jgi:sodium-dependent phosphate cotransporter
MTDEETSKMDVPGPIDESKPTNVEVSISADEEEETPTKEVTSRKDRPTGSIHFGDTDFDVEEDYGDATWGEVCRSCCCHTPREWAMIFVGVVIVLFFLYWFLFGLGLLGDGAKVMTGCVAGSLFGDDANPIAGLMVGILATVLMQSSSTTTSIIVQLVGNNVVTVNQGIYMVMGANIGTSVTNTIVAIGQMGDGDQLERAFAGATVHDVFNFLSVAILLPVEVITHYLAALTGAIVAGITTQKGDKWVGPIKHIVGPITELVIIPNKKLTEGIAANETLSCNSGGGFYPIGCGDNSHPTADTCKFGLIACDKNTNKCPAFYSPVANAADDKVSGGVVFFLGLVILFICLFALVTVLQKLLMGMSTRIIYKATDVNGYLAILIGCGITIVVQSSSITTSTLTPLVGLGVLRLEQMYPLTLGANIGTTLTSIMSSMVSEGTNSLQVALAHLFFNLTGILIFYPVPFMRRIPLYWARRLGRATRLWRGFPFIYILVMFFLVPLIFLGLSYLFEQKNVGMVALGSILTILIGVALFYLGYWCRFKGGKQSCADCFARRERKRVTMKTLPDDMDYLKARVSALIEHTGLPIEDEEEETDETDEEKKELVEKTDVNSNEDEIEA